MKIGCECGGSILDSTDNLSHKAHLILDQDWFNVYDAIDDDVIDPVSEGTLPKENAYMNARQIISSRSRLMWQCPACGRLYIDGNEGTLQCFVPATDETDKRILSARKQSI